MVSHKMRQFLNLFNFITLSPVASRFLFSRLRVTAKDKTIIWNMGRKTITKLHTHEKSLV